MEKVGDKKVVDGRERQVVADEPTDAQIDQARKSTEAREESDRERQSTGSEQVGHNL